MNPKEILTQDSSKTWLVITAVVILLSGFFLYNAIQAKERERKMRIQKEQELSAKIMELTQLQTDLAELKKQKEESELKLNAQITEAQTALQETRKSEEKSRQKITSLQKDKDQLAALVDQNTAMIAKLNKKIEKLEQDKEDLSSAISRSSKTESTYTPAATTAAATTTASAQPAASSSYVNTQVPEVVDLGQIVLHGEAREPARVEHVNTMYGFIVVSAGADDGLKTDTVLNVARDNRFIAKAIVKKVRSSVATAVLLPEWSREEIRLGDQISLNPLELPKESPKRHLADYLPR